MQGKPELLAPCGSQEAVHAAVNGGADAVYLGGTLYHARMSARNFDNDAMCQAIDHCHQNNVAVYVTMNTQLYDRELSDALNYARFLYEAGADALICADLGFASILHRALPALPLHASTQASGHNTEAARELQKIGFSRMVCAREMSQSDIQRLCHDAPIEIEQFVHGALCASHSGQCLMSSMIGGRSGNRGECAQPCRMAYRADSRTSYPLSLKDLCLAGHMTEILESGVASLKLEGRMKSPEYVYGVTSIYRRLIDEGRNATEREINLLARFFCRDGFTDGYYTKKVDATMLGIRTNQDKSATRTIKTSFRPVERKDPKPLHLEERPQAPADLSAFLPEADAASNTPQMSAQFASAIQIPKKHGFSVIYLPLFSYDPQDEYCQRANGVVLPPVIYDCDRKKVLAALEKAKAGGVTHALCGNIGHIALVRQSGLILHADFRCNICNSATAQYWFRMGAQDAILSPELILPQIRDIGGEKAVVAYGHLPLMLLEKRVGHTKLIDRTGATFQILRGEVGLPSGQRDVLYNSVPIYMADRSKVLGEAGIHHLHFLFTTESPSRVKQILQAYAVDHTPAIFPVRRIASKRG